MPESTTNDHKDRQNDRTTSGHLQPSRKQAKQRLNSRFSHIFSTNSASGKHEECTPDFWNNLGAGDIPPKVDSVLAAEAITAAILSAPDMSLPKSHTSVLLQVLETYRNICKDHEAMTEELAHTKREYFKAQDSWSVERQRFMDEIKRLEVIIGSGRDGVLGVINARANSIIDGRKTKRMVNIQTMKKANMRATIPPDKPLPLISPSTSMTALSSALSPTSTKDKMLLGKPPRLSKHLRDAHAEAENGTSHAPNLQYGTDEDEPFFQSTGDPLPDEIGEGDSTLLLTNEQTNELGACRRLASLIAKRRGIDIEPILSDVVDMCYATTKRAESQNLEGCKSNATSTEQWNDKYHGLVKTLPVRGEFLTTAKKNDSEKRVLGSASPSPRRPFSFDPGDDASVMLATNRRRSRKELVALSCDPASINSKETFRGPRRQFYFANPTENFAPLHEDKICENLTTTCDHPSSSTPSPYKALTRQLDRYDDTSYSKSNASSVRTILPISEHPKQNVNESQFHDGFNTKGCSANTRDVDYHTRIAGAESAALTAARVAGERTVSEADRKDHQYQIK